MAARTPEHREEAALSLTLAVIATSTTPLLLLDGDLNVIAASTSFCRTFGIDAATVPGRQLFDLGSGEWNIRQLRSLLVATADGQAEIDAYEMELNEAHRQKRLLLLNARKLSYGQDEKVRLLLAVSDVTEARRNEKLKDDLLREKAVLLQELQHRVANSLQIIASVLLQDARKVRSEETRSHLQSAHGRVMSIAALQQQLSTSGLADVELRTYFKQLCQSLSASVIHHPDLLSLQVSVDDSHVNADISVSLGLIVTELVINAIKHAFPKDHGGTISVDYRSQGDAWTLSVADTGVGMPPGPDLAKAGLGTSIVEALCKQLQARIEVVSDSSGTRISISHTPDPEHGEGELEQAQAV
ncbi:PAS domain-containing protein [Bosea caraganae]|uniref:histidine kinase n=1 Tax=Bosea caraganae TaxID=2763117 RepID=A0A370LA35_9HYPH|nr:histidine kinase dimerization/phosphoacceptor domain -containing protein [Bosea caraganae]RDJ21808.1 PAS domain-containing protein [Bosea caraganae]RDJ28162.1 PAS domain-containing protein [Bosea caraganae]